MHSRAPKKPLRVGQVIDARTPDRTSWVHGLTQRGFHRIAFTDWGPPASARPILCVHGLTRNGRDFDPLAMALADRGNRVVCPDLPGRGRSERLQDDSDYVLTQYCKDMTVMIAALGAKEIDWIGTSLGGLIGMILSAMPGSPIRRLVINDIGPYLPWAGLLRLGANLNNAPNVFASIEEAESYFRNVLAPFGDLTDEHWRHLTAHSVEWNDQRQCFEMLCDPNIAMAFRRPWQYSVDLWKYWDAIRIPVLVIHGEDSDLLSDDVLKDMMRRNAGAEVYNVQNTGHAPALMSDDQIEAVARFLTQDP